MWPIVIRWDGSPPAKSNCNRSGVTRAGRPFLYTTQRVKDIEATFVRLYGQAMMQTGHATIQWVLPKGSTRVFRPANPFFPATMGVIVDIWHVKPNAKGPDVDNIGKSLLDAATQAGLWYDDRQVVDFLVHKRIDPTQIEHVLVRVQPSTFEPMGLPSPLRRREWMEIKRAEEGFESPPLQVSCFCEICTIGIGRNCVEQELWIEPHVHRGKMKFHRMCGSCADKRELDHRYRIVDRYQMQEIGRYDVRLKAIEYEREERSRHQCDRLERRGITTRARVNGSEEPIRKP